MSGPYQPSQPEPTPADPTAGPPPAAPDAWTPPPAPPQYGAPQFPAPTQYQPSADATQPQPQYGAPQSGAPEYGAPQYGAAAPQYGPPTQPAAPQYGAPQYGAPQYGAPQYGAPQYGAPAQPGAPQYPGQFPVPQYTPGQPGQPGQPDAFSVPTYPPPKTGTSAGAKVLRILGVILVVIVVGAVKFGVAGLFNSGLSSTASDKPAPTGPFDQTEAATYPQGEAGIVLPEAAAVTGFTKEKVAAALQQAKKGMIAARLDSTMLVSHDPSALLALLAPDARPDIQKSFDDKDFLSFATQLGTGQTLTSDAIRVKGTLTVKTETTPHGVHVLDVVSNFVWIYPFVGTIKGAGDHLVTVHDEVTWGFPLDADVEPTSRGMFITDTNMYTHNMDCPMFKSGYIGLGKPVFVPGTADPAAADKAALDPNSSIDSGVDTCH